MTRQSNIVRIYDIMIYYVIHLYETRSKEAHSHSGNRWWFREAGGARAPHVARPRVPPVPHKHDFYYHLNARKSHVDCAVCRTLSKHRSDHFVYASGAKLRYKFETLRRWPERTWFVIMPFLRHLLNHYWLV